MKFLEGKVEDINITYIGGGSRGWAWNLMNDLALEPALGGRVRLYDIDKEAASNNAVIGNRITGEPGAKSQWMYEAVEDLHEALDGADFVVLSIQPGTFDEMQSDVHAPEEYGIYQSVGDTVGPGGVIRALRTLPIYIEFAQAIREKAPAAWVINYTNPMTLCTRILYEVFPGIKAFGCCHEVFGTQHLLTRMLSELKGLTDIKRQEIRINVLGINHFTWIDRAHYKKIDLMPLFGKLTEKYHMSGFDSNTSSHAEAVWTKTWFTSAERVKFDLYRRYGLIAAAGDRHLAEFVPPWYLKNPDTAKRWKFSLTPVSWRKEDRSEKNEKALRLAGGEEKCKIESSGEEGVAQIKALLGLGDLVTNVNTVNKGQMGGVPAGPVVETNACFSYNDVTPLQAGRLPSPVESLVMRQIVNQESLIDAVISQNPGPAFNAFCNDPLVSLSVADSKDLFKTMLENTRAYLPSWCKW